jgi:hypothetical protein
MRLGWIALGILVGVTACVPPDEIIENVDSGTQIGAEDCGSDLIEIRLRDMENLALLGSVVYVYEDEAPVTLDCPYKCSILDPGMGIYEMTATVDEVSMSQSVALEDADLQPAAADCPPYYEKIVRFEFNE